MSTALDRAATILKEELDNYGIEVPFGERVIIWDGLAVNVEFGTPKSVCLRKLRKMIKIAELTRSKEEKRKEVLPMFPDIKPIFEEDKTDE